MPRRERSRLVVVAAIAALVGTACTGGTPSGRTTPATLRFEGTLLVSNGQGSIALASYDPATRRLTRIRVTPSNAFDFVAGARWTGPGTAVFMGQPENGRGRLYRIDGARATPLGPPSRVGSLVGVSGEMAVATECFPDFGRLAVLDLAEPTSWRPLGEVCGEAMSPDGSTVAVGVPKNEGRSIFGGFEFSLGAKVWTQPLAASGTRQLVLDVTKVPALRRFMVADPQVLRVAWGPAGLAVAVGNGETSPWALVIVSSTDSGGWGPPRVIPLGQAEPFDMAWQPNGDVLAFTSCYQCTTFGRNPAHVADVRLYDARTGTLRQIAAANNFLTGLVWSPDGSEVVTRTPDSELLFVDVEGRVEVRRSIDAFPEDWRS